MKKIVAFLLSVAFAVTALCGCSYDPWAVKTNSYTISKSDYETLMIYQVYKAYRYLKSQNENISLEDDEIFQKVMDNGQITSDWLIENTKKIAKLFIGAQEEFDKMGMTISDESMADIKEYSKSNSTRFSEAIDYDNRVTLEIEVKKLTDLFRELYKDVSRDELLAYLNENGASYNYIEIVYSGEDESHGALQTAQNFVNELNSGKSVEEVAVSDTYSVYNYTHQVIGATSTVNLPFSFGNVSNQLKEAVVNSLTPGASAMVVEGDGVYYVVQRTVPSMDDVSLNENKLLVFAKWSEYRDRLNTAADEAGYKENTSVIESVTPEDVWNDVKKSVK